MGGGGDYLYITNRNVFPRRGKADCGYTCSRVVSLRDYLKTRSSHMCREKYPDHYNGVLRCWDSHAFQGKLLGATALTMGIRGPELVTNTVWRFPIPFCCPLGKFLCSACDTLASKWCSCFSLVRLTQIFPDTQSQMHQRGWPFVQRYDLASSPFHPAVISHLQPKFPFVSIVFAITYR